MTRGAGTPNYIAPEVQCNEYFSSVDIYSLGLTSLSLLTGCVVVAANFDKTIEEVSNRLYILIVFKEIFGL